LTCDGADAIIFDSEIGEGFQVSIIMAKAKKATPQDLLALEEMRRTFDAASKASDNLDGKASALLRSSSIITSLFAALQLTLIDDQPSGLYIAGVVVLLLAYIILVIACTFSMYPRKYKTPVRADWDTLSEHIISIGHRDAVLRLANSYAKKSRHNRAINCQKASRIRLSSYIVAFNVILIVMLSTYTLR